MQGIRPVGNTPSEGIGASPAQRFLGRRCRTFLPATTSLLQPQFPTQEHTRKLHKQKRQQNRYYDQHVRTLKPIKVGDPVLMRLPGQSRWSQGECIKLVGPRSPHTEGTDDTLYKQVCCQALTQCSQSQRTYINSQKVNHPILRIPHRLIAQSTQQYQLQQHLVQLFPMIHHHHHHDDQVEQLEHPRGWLIMCHHHQLSDNRPLYNCIARNFFSFLA